MSGPVEDKEPIARFFLKKKDLDRTNPANPVIKPEGFLPHPSKSNPLMGEASVFRVEGMTEEEIQLQGNRVADEREKNYCDKILEKGEAYNTSKRCFQFRGIGLCQAIDIRIAGLDVVPDEPPPRHAKILGWIPFTGNSRKEIESGHLRQAMVLVSKFKFIPAKT